MSVAKAVASRWVTGLLRLAKYDPEFLQWAERMRFPSPKTQDRIKFVSLPPEEQTRIYQRWMSIRGRQIEEEPTTSHEPSYDHVELEYERNEEKAREIVKNLLGEEDEAKQKARLLDLAGMSHLGSMVKDISIDAVEGKDGSHIQVDGRGEHGLYFTRVFNYDQEGKPDYIENELFGVEEGAPPGVATRMLAGQLDAADRDGFKKIKAFASGDPEDPRHQGYYAWPRIGFNLMLRDDSGFEQKMPPDLKKQVEELAEADPEVTYPEMRHLMMLEEGRDWWKENGWAINVDIGTGDEHKNSPERRMIGAYFEEKARRAGASSVQDWMGRVASDEPPRVGDSFGLEEEDEEILNNLWDRMRQHIERRKTASTWLRGFVRIAKYPPEFLQWAETQRFPSLKTRKPIKFVSLPPEEQTRIYQQWAQRRQQQQQQEAQPQQTEEPEETDEQRERREQEATQLARNKDPKRYEQAEVEFILPDNPEFREAELKALERAFGTRDEREVMNQLLDLGGLGGAAELVERSVVNLIQDPGQTMFFIKGTGKDGLEFDREIVFEDPGEGEERMIPSHITNHSFSIGKERQGQGIGTRMLASQVAAATDQGFSHIETRADRSYGTNGYYSWPRLGYNNGLDRGILDELSEVDPDAAAEVEALAESDDQRLFTDSPIELYHLMAVPAARAWWKEEGRTIDVSFPLNDLDGGRAEEVLRQYVLEKAKRAGKSIPDFVSRLAASKKRKKGPSMGVVFDEEDEVILNRVWDGVYRWLKEQRKKKKASRVAGRWLRLALSQEKFEELTHDMENEDLAFGHIFGDKKRLVVPAPDLKPEFDEESQRIISQELTNLGHLKQKEEIDWEEGVVTDEDGGKTKLGKRVAKATAKFEKAHPKAWKAIKNRIRTLRRAHKTEENFRTYVDAPLRHLQDQWRAAAPRSDMDLSSLFQAVRNVQGKDLKEDKGSLKAVVLHEPTRKLPEVGFKALEFWMDGMEELLSAPEDIVERFKAKREETEEKRKEVRAQASALATRLREKESKDPDDRARLQKLNRESDTLLGQIWHYKYAETAFENWPLENRQALAKSVRRATTEMGQASEARDEAFEELKAERKALEEEADRKTFNSLYQLERGRQDYDRWKSEGQTMSVVVSRAPVDVLRMSDHPTAPQAIHSCHSEGGDYFECAIDEAHGTGLVAYAVDDKDLKGVDLEADELFEDRDRAVQGIKPYSRLRLRRFERDDGSELAIPEHAVYGAQYEDFVDFMTDWAREQQKEVFEEKPRMSEYSLTGGDYRDTHDAQLFNKFFDTPDRETGDTAHKKEKEKSLFQSAGFRRDVDDLMHAIKQTGMGRLNAYAATEDALEEEDEEGFKVEFQGLLEDLGDEELKKEFGYDEETVNKWRETIKSLLDRLEGKEGEKEPEPEQPAPEQPQAPTSEDFWDWMGQHYPEVPNPNPEGRQQRIAPSTLKEYAEGGDHQQRAQQMVQRYMQTFQQQQQQRRAQRLGSAWLWGQLLEHVS